MCSAVATRIQKVLGSNPILGPPPPPLGLHRYIEQYLYYPAVVYLSAFTVRSIILFTNVAILHINQTLGKSKEGLEIGWGGSVHCARNAGALPIDS